MKLKQIKKFLIYIVAIIPFIAVCTIDLPLKGNNEIAVAGSIEEFDYKELKEKSSVIALVEVIDDLTSENSVINLLDDSMSISGFYGKRDVKVIKYYKDDRGYGESLKIIEPAIVTEDNEYIHLEEYEKMERGNKYIVFLSDETESGNLSIISGNNGKINISNIDDNYYDEILVKSIIDFETNKNILSDESKSVILNSEQLNIESEKSLTNPKDNEILQETISTNLKDLELEVYYDDNLEKEIINIDGINLISDEELIIE